MPKPRNSKRKLIEQVCVIPYRRREADDGLEVCLITSLIKKRWIFPKGVIDPGETPVEAALKEVWEEAGLRGEIVGAPLGQFNDQKWGCDLRVQVLVMKVQEIAERWPETDQRQRQWVTPDAATRQLNRSELKSFLGTACQWLQAESAARLS
jgi:8-oxo-dGTP pyrophosphatase MutT (NUDIX family)